ncbi:hypothetical protein ACOZ4N_02800 [Halorientalis pallida]|uniref:hypothetical protein n=1 Tax=Halorientalis pallida TaxID=2479928 RepID=UPI003C6F97B1
MSTASATVSRWTRRFVAAGACWLVLWSLAALVGLPRRTEVTLALSGFVFHTLFGKAYALVPAYFDRELAVPRAPTVQLPLSVLGTLGLAAAGLPWVPGLVGASGAILWATGVAVFLGTLAWTVRDNLAGAETGTGDHDAARRPVDRMANAAMPVAFAYLAVGTAVLVTAHTPVDAPFAYAPQRTHLFAAGTAALLVFSVGFRLLPRFFVADPPKPLVAVALSLGAGAPLILALTLPAGPIFRFGATLEALAVVAFALAVLWLVVESDRERVGRYGVVLGALSGVAVVGLGLSFAFVGLDAALVVTHYRVALVGFLGLTIVGVATQFYPPAVGAFPVDADRLALGAMAALASGLVVDAAGRLADQPTIATGGLALATLGTVGYAWLLLGIFRERARGGPA